MATVLITGGTGLIGKAITGQLLEQGHEVIILTRHPEKHAQRMRSGVSYAAWDIQAQTIQDGVIQKADYIIHLAGAGVADKRWTKARKEEIRNSRVQAGALLVKAITAATNNRLKAVICASAIGWYGPDQQPVKPFTETDAPSADFLGNTCRDWEASVAPLQSLCRLVTYRIGIVMSAEGGAMKEFLKPLRLGVAAVLGSGKQIVSWIHIKDIAALFLYAMENEKLAGVFNAVAPAPVSNRELVMTLAKKKNRFYIPVRVPSFVLRILLGEMSIEILKSTTVSADKLIQSGFRFQYPVIEQAV